MRYYTKFQLLGFFLGPAVALIMILSPTPSSLSLSAWNTAAVAIFLAIYWITEPIPLYVTALIPIIVFPLLNISTVKETTTQFGHPLIFLFLGGFLIAEAIQKWGLHKRIALNIIRIIGLKPKNIIAGFMISGAFLSMWISNTATTLMMLPIGISVISVYNSKIEKTDKKNNFGIALMLSIAYSCSIGGIGTLIGTPPNALMAAFMNESYNIEIGFAQWMMIGIPFVFLALPLAYFLLTRVIFPMKTAEAIQSYLMEEEFKSLGKMRPVEKRILAIFILTAVLWIIRPLITKYVNGISDTSIVVFTSLLLFFLPSGKGEPILQWKDAKNISWGILLLFGGGLALAMGIKKSGLAEAIANFILQIHGIPIIVLITILTASIIILTELSSNTATAAAFLPIIASVAVGLGVNPLELVIPATIAASCAFMLPVATPPNAIVFSSNQVTIKDMTRAGIWLVVSFVFLIVIVTHVLVDIVF